MTKSIVWQNGKALIHIKNQYLDMLVSNYGCTLMRLYVKDRNGQMQDVILGYDSLYEYQHHDGYLGALIGRVANRIGNAKFDLNDRTFHLAANDGKNTLHGGKKGFSHQFFDYMIQDDSVFFHYLSKDMEEGFPGNLHLFVHYQLCENVLVMHTWAECDQDTLINITHHAYFNLSGYPNDISSHSLVIHANQYGCINEDGLVNGKIEKVDQTSFDFRKEKWIGHHLLDHPFIFNQDFDQVILYCKQSGIECTVSTTLPLAQIYTANHLDGRKGKHNMKMKEHSAICIETQYMPDSIHVEKDPKIILRKGHRYDETTSYRFKVRK